MYSRFFWLVFSAWAKKAMWGGLNPTILIYYLIMFSKSKLLHVFPNYFFSINSGRSNDSFCRVAIGQNFVKKNKTRKPQTSKSPETSLDVQMLCLCRHFRAGTREGASILQLQRLSRTRLRSSNPLLLRHKTGFSNRVSSQNTGIVKIAAVQELLPDRDSYITSQASEITRFPSVRPVKRDLLNQPWCCLQNQENRVHDFCGFLGAGLIWQDTSSGE